MAYMTLYTSPTHVKTVQCQLRYRWCSHIGKGSGYQACFWLWDTM